MRTGNRDTEEQRRDRCGNVDSCGQATAQDDAILVNCLQCNYLLNVDKLL